MHTSIVGEFGIPFGSTTAAGDCRSQCRPSFEVPYPSENDGCPFAAVAVQYLDNGCVALNALTNAMVGNLLQTDRTAAEHVTENVCERFVRVGAWGRGGAL